MVKLRITIIPIYHYLSKNNNTILISVQVHVTHPVLYLFNLTN